MVSNQGKLMLNIETRDKAVKDLKRSVETYNKTLSKVAKKCEELHLVRNESSNHTIKLVESYVNKLAKTPKEFDKDFKVITGLYTDFNHYVKSLEAENSTSQADASAAQSTFAGIVSASGVAVLGPSLAMAVATTFGTASTGTAIATLSGAAASNAALAWLGGGALVAGGGGVAAGNALLMLAGPIGWGIAGVATVGTGIWYASKNAEIAQKALDDANLIRGYNVEREFIYSNINKLIKLSKDVTKLILGHIEKLENYAITDYELFDDKHKDILISLINHTRTLGELLKKDPKHFNAG